MTGNNEGRHEGELTATSRGDNSTHAPLDKKGNHMATGVGNGNAVPSITSDDKSTIRPEKGGTFSVDHEGPYPRIGTLKLARKSSRGKTQAPRVTASRRTVTAPKFATPSPREETKHKMRPDGGTKRRDVGTPEDNEGTPTLPGELVQTHLPVIETMKDKTHHTPATSEIRAGLVRHVNH